MANELYIELEKLKLNVVKLTEERKKLLEKLLTSHELIQLLLRQKLELEVECANLLSIKDSLIDNVKEKQRILDDMYDNCLHCELKKEYEGLIIELKTLGRLPVKVKGKQWYL